MNSARFNRRAHAFTLVEMLVVITIIALLLAMLLPVLAASNQRAKRIVCESQLRQIGLGFQCFAHDHNSKFPMQVPAGDGGSLEFVQAGNQAGGQFYFAFRHFQTLSGALQTPAILVCPADRRLAATNFPALQNSNVSYFVGVTADYSQPMTILAGDGNLAAASTTVRGSVGGRLTWTRAVHRFKGNVLFADGHVEEWSDLGANRLASGSEFVLPSIRGGGKYSERSAAANTARGNDSSGDVTGNLAAGADSSTNASPRLPKNHSEAGAPVHIGSGNTGGGAASSVEISSPAVTNTPTTNGPAGGGSVRPGDDDLMMSPFDRQMAKFLREIIVGTYLLLLLLLLLFAAYRLWRHLNDPEYQRRRQRRQTGN